LSENFVDTGHFQRNFDKVFRQRSTTKLGTRLLGQALDRVFATAHFLIAYWAAPAKLERLGMTLDLSIHLKSTSIIVAPYLTVEQAAFPLMGLATSPHRCIHNTKLDAVSDSVRGEHWHQRNG
jgi:hypothetical protein